MSKLFLLKEVAQSNHIIQKKPHKWDFKMFTRAGRSGIVYYLTMYIGEGTCLNYGLGISSDIVIHLVNGLPEHENSNCILIIGLSLFT